MAMIKEIWTGGIKLTNRIPAKMLKAGMKETSEFCSQFDNWNAKFLFIPAMVKAGIKEGLTPQKALKFARAYNKVFYASSHTV